MPRGGAPGCPSLRVEENDEDGGGVSDRYTDLLFPLLPLVSVDRLPFPLCVPRRCEKRCDLNVCCKTAVSCAASSMREDDEERTDDSAIPRSPLSLSAVE